MKKSTIIFLILSVILIIFSTAICQIFANSVWLHLLERRNHINRIKKTKNDTNFETLEYLDDSSLYINFYPHTYFLKTTFFLLFLKNLLQY